MTDYELMQMMERLYAPVLEAQQCAITQNCLPHSHLDAEAYTKYLSKMVEYRTLERDHLQHVNDNMPSNAPAWLQSMALKSLALAEVRVTRWTVLYDEHLRRKPS
jgi:hypothetical protein